MSDQDDFKLVRPFGPTMVKLKMPEKLVENLNACVDDYDASKNNNQFRDHGNQLAGNVSQEIAIEKELVISTGWLNFLGDNTKRWIQETTERTIKKFELHNTWIVRQYEKEYNPAHIHTGHVSGVGYLKVPKTMGKTVQSEKPVNKNGCIDFLYGSPSFLAPAQQTIVPEIGVLYLFPHYLMHTVYPFWGYGERRSISFNASVDNDIYEHFG